MRNKTIKPLLLVALVAPALGALTSCGPSVRYSEVFNGAKAELNLADYVDFTDLSSEGDSITLTTTSGDEDLLSKFYDEATEDNYYSSYNNFVYFGKSNGKYWAENIKTGNKTDSFDEFSSNEVLSLTFDYYDAAALSDETLKTGYLIGVDKTANTATIIIVTKNGFAKGATLSRAATDGETYEVSQKPTYLTAKDGKAYGVINFGIANTDITSSFIIEGTIGEYNDFDVLNGDLPSGVMSVGTDDLEGLDISYYTVLPGNTFGLDDSYLTISETAEDPAGLVKIMFKCFDYENKLKWSRTLNFEEFSQIVSVSDKKALFMESHVLEQGATTANDAKYFYMTKDGTTSKYVQTFKTIDLNNGNVSDVELDFAIYGVEQPYFSSKQYASENAGKSIGGLVYAKTIKNNFTSTATYTVVVNGEGKVSYDLTDAIYAEDMEVSKLSDNRYLIEASSVTKGTASVESYLVDENFNLVANLKNNVQYTSLDSHSKLIICEDDYANKYGAIDFDGKVVVNFEYVELFATHNSKHLIGCNSDQEYVLISVTDNGTNKEVIGKYADYELVDATAVNGCALFKSKVDSAFYSLNVETAALTRIGKDSATNTVEDAGSLYCGLLYQKVANPNGGSDYTIYDYAGNALFTNNVVTAYTPFVKYFYNHIYDKNIDSIGLNAAPGVNHTLKLTNCNNNIFNVVS